METSNVSVITYGITYGIQAFNMNLSNDCIANNIFLFTWLNHFVVMFLTLIVFILYQNVNADFNNKNARNLVSFTVNRNIINRLINCNKYD